MSIPDPAAWPVDPAYEPRGGQRDLTHRDADWSGLSVVVVGLGLSGFAAADALLERGAEVTVVSRDRTDVMTERARILDILGATVRFGQEHLQAPPAGTELVVTSPGVPPHNPFLVAAADAAHRCARQLSPAWRRLGVVVMAVGEQGQRHPGTSGGDMVEHRLQVGLVVRAGVDDHGVRAAGLGQDPGVGALQGHRRRVGAQHADGTLAPGPTGPGGVCRGHALHRATPCPSAPIGERIHSRPECSTG